MAALKTLLALFISLTLCGTIMGLIEVSSFHLKAAEDGPKEEEERGVFGSGGVLKQDTNPANETSTGGLFNRRPCNCRDNSCRCCIRTFFPMPPLLRQRACLNLTYADEESGLNMIIVYNRRTLYNNTVGDQGRNPVPICVSPPLFPRAELCAQLTEVYVKRQNMHACLKVEGHFSNRTLFGRTMGCMYVGPNGFAIVRPEADGSVPGIEGPDTSEEEGQDSVEEGSEESTETSSAAAETEPTPTEGTRSVETKEEGEGEEVKKEEVKEKNEITDV